jgi:exodeoxyribonuclease V
MKINYTTGYAGTGKSTELLELLHTLDPEHTVVLAPTHKAIGRLMGEYDGDIEMKTIHSLLGLIPTINEGAKNISQISTTINLNHPLQFYKNIVIDEAGMINEEHFLDLVSKLEELEDDKDLVTLHLFLDPYQLLPVKGYQLQPDPATTKNLTQQHRSEALDIVCLYTKFVDYLQGNNNDLTTPYSTNVLPLDIKEFKVGDRLLAYTNQAVGQWNIDIARHLGIKNYIGQEVQIGSTETIIVEEFVNPTHNEIYNAYMAGKLKLQNSNINKKFLEPALRALKHSDIKFIKAGGFLIPVVVGIGNASIIHKKAGEEAIKNRSKFSHVYALGRAFIMDYNFASTVHKAQGQEFDTVFVDKLDIQKSIRNGYYETYARLMYVSISRCKRKLYI